MDVAERNQWIVDNIRFIHCLCQPYRERADYEDIVQTAVLGAVAALDRVDESKGDKAIRQYVASYADGYIRNFWLKKASTVYIPRWAWDHGVRAECYSIEYEYDSENTFESMYLSCEESGYEEVELMTDFKQAISGLPEKMQRTALMLAEGYERSEIAKMDGCSHQAICNRMSVVRHACRKLYA